MVPGRPAVGDRFYQEIAPGVAMDRARIVSLDASIRTPAGEFKGCLEFVETTPLEPLARDTKTYAPGIGLVKDGPLLLVEHGRKEGKRRSAALSYSPRQPWALWPCLRPDRLHRRARGMEPFFLDAPVGRSAGGHHSRRRVRGAPRPLERRADAILFEQPG
jgi:hypothetical protein